MIERKNPTEKTCEGCSVKEYFKHVDNHTKDELKALFKIDFEMFGYSEDDIWFLKIFSEYTQNTLKSLLIIILFFSSPPWTLSSQISKYSCEDLIKIGDSEKIFNVYFMIQDE